jgi:antitoxin component YwqK of YwqJK toxin-antitoxin module
MKKYLLAVLMLLCMHQTNAATLYDQLCSLNYNWKKYKNHVPAEEAHAFKSNREYIQAHLQCVLSVLRSNPVDQFNCQQLQSRQHLIKFLQEYCNSGNFPLNYHYKKRIPVFIDEHQTHCAVGYLLQQTGYEKMAQRIAATSNYAWLKDIYDKEFPAWQQTSGLTLEELKLIQGAYDFYLPDAFIAPNKYEIPQKPSCIIAYFENKKKSHTTEAKDENIWCKGEGENGILNGRWEQNYAPGIPWIIGFYENGKRSGQWQEYYQGTSHLCRIENWRNDKLNGVRRRFSMTGALIEEILFAEGNAITKTNYDVENSLTWIRKPLDSNLIWTEVFTSGGALIGRGHERIYNPGNLLWFQNIELTALNSISLTSRDISLSQNNVIAFSHVNPSSHLRNPFRSLNLYNSPPLVEYKKEGDWMYYKEYATQPDAKFLSHEAKNMIRRNYKYFGEQLVQSINLFDDAKAINGYDSIKVTYKKNLLQSFYAYGSPDYLHLQIRYQETNDTNEGSQFILVPSEYGITESAPAIKMIGQYNREHQKIGIWKYYNNDNAVYKTENYIIAWKEEDEDDSY